ncbi:protein-glutamate methylesterase/protein-glutamine glutaminase [Bacillus xiapuensis]|uniref:protein-glutamate methylesterase/protein-glutamine glutaminase n=1 Tax=Bacillus xiapuensis TaxID=2014075 RepID=UPI000C231CDC|nr:chemotaxis response regulator protein-glutamate methylesterase [Bacillus xiapuensis]
MRGKKVLVVDDSAFMRKLITDFLSAHPELDVVATARNGKDAIIKVEKYQPDVMTMDVEMPEMDGLDALSHIMKHTPTPVVMLSSLTKEGAETTLMAMERGAVDFIAKPSGTISLDLERIKDELIEKVLAASEANIRPIAEPAAPQPSNLVIERENKSLRHPPKLSLKNREGQRDKPLVVIGTSTGGPRALQRVLTKLPADLGAPVLIVQHMPAGFTKSLAQRLDSLSAITVKEAQDGEVIRKNTAYIAPGNYHLKVKKAGESLAVHLDQSPPVNGHRPSVDALFESVSAVDGFMKIAVIMTGMGADGAEGLMKMKELGKVRAIAESKDSCVVYGMPRAAIATHLVDDVVAVNQIAATIEKYLPQKG